MMGRKTQVDDLTALREATREAHEAIRDLTAARKAAADERALLDQRKEELADMVAALWDAKMDAIVEEALGQYLPAIRSLIETTEKVVTERLETTIEVLMNPQEYDVAKLIEERFGDKPMSAIESLAFSSVLDMKGRLG